MVLYEPKSGAISGQFFPRPFFETVCLSGLQDHGFPGFLNFRAFNILVECHESIDNAAGSDLDNSVYHGIQELVVMGGEKNHLLEIEQAFI
jgi:hypothetical protein